MDTLLSTQDLASLLKVTETTIKRWSDGGRIFCIRTLGGHRKFHLHDVIKFAETNRYPINGLLPPPMSSKQLDQLQLGIATKDYGRISDVLLQEILQGDREGITTLLLHLLKHHIPFYTITDEVIRPALVSVGDLWMKGELSIHQEHIASHAITESLIRITPEVYRKSPNGLSAAFACVEGELHDIGLRCLAYSFESEGWKIHFIGANTPVESMISFVRDTRPDLVALSATTTPMGEKLIGAIRRLAGEVHSMGGKLVLGGVQSGEISLERCGCDRLVHSARESIEFTRDVFRLKRGPHRKTEDVSPPLQ